MGLGKQSNVESQEGYVYIYHDLAPKVRVLRFINIICQIRFQILKVTKRQVAEFIFNDLFLVKTCFIHFCSVVSPISIGETFT